MTILNTLMSVLSVLWDFLGSLPILLFVMICAATIKFYFIVSLFRHLRKNKHIYLIRRSIILLIIVLITSFIDDTSWIIKLTRTLLIPTLNKKFCVLWIRIAWANSIVYWHALALFIESLVEKRKIIGTRQKILIPITATFFIAFIAFSILSFDMTDFNKSRIEMQLITGLSQYGLFPLLALSLLITTMKLHNMAIPQLLKSQVKLLTKTMLTPLLIIQLLETYPFSMLHTQIGNKHAFATLSALILLYAIFYCARSIIGLRFLNFKSHVELSGDFHLINDFRHVLEQFGTVTNARELAHITKTFFEQAFHVHPHKTHLYIREQATQGQMLEEIPAQPDRRQILVERFLELPATTQPTVTPFKSGEALFLDELAFNDFYNDTRYTNTLELLRNLDADVLIPIMEQEQLIAYIIIDRRSRTKESGIYHEFYNDTERDYMLVFSDYLKNILLLLHDGNFDLLLHQKKRLEEDVYLRHQEMNQYKESMQSFIKASGGREIGIIFYKNSRFMLGNKCARDFIKIDLNLHSGHPLTKQLKKIAQQILEYKTPQTCLIDGHNSQKLVISGIPNIEHNNIIITIHHPEISDLLRKKTELLNDPQDWGLFLCLETTSMGYLIDRFIPGHGEILLNFKVKLLKASLGKKAVLLDVSGDDLPPLVDLMHTIGLRENLHTIVLHERVTSTEIAIKLFGINSLFNTQAHERPLLEKLNNNGTLFIQNVHFLDLETQEYLAEFLRYGVYRRLKSDHKTHSNTRVICSTNKNLYEALQEGTFSRNLFEELHNNTLAMPSLSTIPKDELLELIDLITKQTAQLPTSGNLFDLTDREKQKLLNAHLPSLYELRIKIKNLLTEKAKHATQEDETLETADIPANETLDQELIEAAQLGRHALKNKRVMGILWKKFQNQNKIAMFLGVNRSSVNRRCKEHGLIE